MAEKETGKRFALVTGAFSGIGKATASLLRARGFIVFAGLLDEAQHRALASEGDETGRIIPLVLDITDEASIAAARARVEERTGGAGLDALVNNAGIALAGPIEFLPLALIRRQLEVNLIGHIAVTQAFASMIRKRKGRIINIGSVSCRVSNLFLSPYAMSKHALKAWNDSLRMELRRWGIGVSLIEPGNVSTSIWTAAFAEIDRLAASMPPEGTRLYGQMISTMKASMAGRLSKTLAPEDVAAKVLAAIESRRPRAFYPVGMDRRVKVALAMILRPHAYDRFIWKYLGLDSLPPPDEVSVSGIPAPSPGGGLP